MIDVRSPIAKILTPLMDEAATKNGGKIIRGATINTIVDTPTRYSQLVRIPIPSLKPDLALPISKAFAHLEIDLQRLDLKPELKSMRKSHKTSLIFHQNPGPSCASSNNP